MLQGLQHPPAPPPHRCCCPAPPLPRCCHPAPPLPGQHPALGSHPAAPAAATAAAGPCPLPCACQVLLQRHWRRCPAETRLPAPPHGGKRRHLQIGQKQRAAAAGLRLFGTASHKMEPVLCRRQYWQRQRHAAIWSTDHTQPVNKRSSKPCCRPAPVTLAGTCSRQCRRQAGASAPARCLAGLCRRRHQP